MKKLRNSLLAQYLLIILVATMILPISIPLLSFFLYKSVEQADSTGRYYNGTDLEEMWHETAKGLTGASEAQIHQKLLEMKNVYQEASMYRVDGTGLTRGKIPESLAIPDTWTASDAVDFMKKNQGHTIDPFTVVAFIGNEKQNGFIVLQIPRSDMIKPSDKLRAQNNYIFPIALLSIFAFFILISTLFFYRIRKRLISLQDIMATPEENGIPLTIKVYKQDEIGRLEQSFNQMVQELETGRQREKKEEELRKELIASMSHDLRTPLTTVRGHAFRLKTEPLSTKGQESVDFIDEKVNYMGELIENLLSYTLLTTGKYPFNPKKVDIVRLIRTSFAAWYPVFEDLQFNIKVDISEKRLMWEVDPQWIHRVLDNLFQNVYRHAKSGRFVSVRVENEAVVIEDHGPGMRGKSTQSGVGIGLSIVSLMIKEMQLDWTIESGAHGTTIRIQK
ncbi:HAMP domain-containing histidine kinase [Viridibacillus sp. YIM B01967]|uniref:histidine kinase n=1 Tax=Viridibacillus soli TaxID=2798301 RepID=A0ABS1HD62_9BACL|nr:HAMP domain-containing sensor histidine kinase [Viridibacillus soli]MBK3497325.1 HAMP domain-containing histidine kinase [Viridibacillus soli]